MPEVIPQKQAASGLYGIPPRLISYSSVRLSAFVCYRAGCPIFADLPADSLGVSQGVDRSPGRTNAPCNRSGNTAISVGSYKRIVDKTALTYCSGCRM